MPTRSGSHIDAVLAKISRRVLEDVWIGGYRRAFLTTVAATLVGGAITGWLQLASQATTSWISWSAIALFGLAGSASLIAVAFQRFRWCCAAAYVSGMATVVGWALVWWHRTAPPGTSPGTSAWMVVGALAATVLALMWLGVIIAPSERSQPDMRAAAATAKARSGTRGW